MKPKWIITAFAALVAALAALIFWYRWDSGTNHGLTFGYWKSYNNISNSLARLPGVTIVDAGCNADVTLEQFGFDVKTTGGAVLKIWFDESDPIRQMRGEPLKLALANKIRNLSTNEIK